ncbi:D-alanyl-D-alanine carboxypeptidase [Streptomyces griseomycini]|uniref:D-alanyl-D-alanine carboxypeptidase n=1 Tax=Streptomyces griseomycini TaxID=66895 RepID=UPI0018769C17|nr:D-alanyl-D-alanine carboxypeptidase [Streptomyces griseomycini]
MEEASVAGESPDRSKQRESSAEPTSGSAGPVPEARNSTETQDPRLAVAREAAPSGGRGSVDTATQVLSVREATEEAAEAGDASSGKRDGSAPEGDGRLHEAVAAWVRSAAPDEADAAPRDDSGDERAAVAAGGPKTGDADEAEDAPEGGSDADASGPEAGEPSRGGTDAEDAEDGDEDAVDEAPAGAPEAAASTIDQDDEPRDATTPAATDDDVTPSPGSEDADADGPRSGDAPAATDDDVTPSPGSGETGAGATPRDSAPAADDGSEDADADGPRSGDAPAATDDDVADAPAGAGSEGPVDQPTAVFRTGRPSAPSVDQPTTMLKLGGAAPGAEPDGASADAGTDSASDSKSESESERTSKFVALKALDDPDTRKPPRGGDATTALRTVTPAAKPPAPSPAEATASVPQIGPERTTQQPLPPKPPLDLLAELTNTPPPPETPLRTAVRRVKIWTPLVLLLVIVFAVVQAVRPLPTPTLVLTAEDTHTFDGGRVKLPWPDEGQGWMSGDGIGTMDHFGEQKPVAIGSVAKTMTAYIILREHPLKPGEEGPKIEIDAKAEKEGGYDKDGESTLNTVKAGDFLTEKQALSAVMVPSANNIARLLARWDAGSEEAFVKKMNDTAKELGMTNTTYTDPSGLKETTVSTAEDQTKLGIAAMKIPAMVAITSAASWTDPSGQYWSNYNELPYTMGAIGIKTGSTTKAGGNLLFAARKKVGGQEVTVVGAILGQHKGPSILDTVNEVSKPALRAAQEALASEEILKKGEVVGYVDDGLGGRTPVAVAEDVKAVGWAGLSVKLTFAANELPHRAEAGTEVGALTVGDGTSSAVKVPVALREDLVEPGLTDKLTRLS